MAKQATVKKAPAKKQAASKKSVGGNKKFSARKSTTVQAEAAKKAQTKRSTAKGTPSAGKIVAKAHGGAGKSVPRNLLSSGTVDQKQMGFPIVALGASAGGLEAFETFFMAMCHDSGIAFILVAHLDPTHVSLLPELLQKRTKMPVHQVTDGMKVQCNNIYVIPPNKNLTILNGVMQLTDLPQPRGGNLPIDSFFRSLAMDQGSNAVCIILSGTGTDGTLGLKAIKGELGMVMVQDVESAKYDGMPRSAIATGLADYVLPPERMPEQLIKYTKHAFLKGASVIASTEGKTPNALQKIYAILRMQTGHDFSLYKKNTICRRIKQRMNIHQIDDIAGYARYLQDSEREAGILFKELLIGVTNFFRDAAAFDVLRDKFIPKLLKGKPDNYTVRAWVTGCSSGEEAYSLAIILQECMERIKRHFSVQIFGTDIDKDAVNFARAGLYPESILADVSPERLKRYFTKGDDDRYRIKKVIREMLVFAPQNVLKDPPFTKMDILSCRNLLIYLEPELQKKLFPIFHYSLKPDGILFLGSSETIGQATDLFATLDRKWKIFSRQASVASAYPVLDFPDTRTPFEHANPEVTENIRKTEEISSLQLIETILQQSNTPPCAIIDDAGNIVYIHGRTGRFLEPAEGKISVNILEMVRSCLKSDLATAIRKAAINKQEVIHRGLRIENNGDYLFLDLSVKPILEQSVMRGLMMVVFEETAKPSKKSLKESQREPLTAIKKLKGKKELERALQYTRENLQTTIEELETSNEELQSTNEELQSTNEELQSTNEEIETSKEELQSLNEESATVNAELQSRIDELSKANDDMKNLLDSTDTATLFLDTELCIRRFTPRATAIIPLTNTDLGRPIRHFATSLIKVDLAEYGKKVLEDLTVREAEFKSQDGRTYTMKVRPYRTVSNVIDGVVIVFEDITARKRAEEELRRSEARFRGFVESSTDWIWEVNTEGIYTYAGPQVEAMLGYQPEDVIGKTTFDLMPREEAERISDILKDVSKKGESIDTLETVCLHKDGRRVTLERNGVPIFGEAGEIAGYRGVDRDITDRKPKKARK